MAKGYIYDKLYNRKIEGDSSFADEKDVADVKGDLVEVDGRLDDLESVSQLNISTTTIPEGVVESETAYKKCIVMNNMLWLVIECKITNNNEASVNLGNIAYLIDVPEAIGKKIFKYDGKSIDEYESGQATQITSIACYVGTSSKRFACVCYGKNKLNPYIENAGSIGAGASANISVRLPLVLI